MRSRVLFLILLIAYAPVVLSQDDQTPFVLRGKDTASVNRLNKLALAAYLSNPEKTELYSRRAMFLADSLNFPTGLADSYYAMSLVSKLKADNSEELDFHLRSLKIYEAVKDSSSIARALSNIGVVYQNKNDSQTAREFYQRALELFKSIHDLIGFASTLRKIGNMEMDLKNFDKGLEAYQKSLTVEKSINNQEGIANALNNIGVMYFEQGKYEEALPYYIESLAIIRRINNLNRLPAAYHNIARVYFAQGKYDEALKLALEDLPLARKAKSRGATMEAAQLLSEVYHQKKDYAKALEFLILHNQIRDSVQQEDNSAHFAQLHAVYQTEEKEKEIELIRKDNELTEFRQRILTIVLLAALLAGVFIIYLLRNRVKAKQEIIHKNQELHDVQLGLAQVELENKRLDERRLQSDLEFRHKELLTYTLNLVQKNTIMQHLREGIHELLSSTDDQSKLKMTKLIKAIDYSLESEKDWDEFRMYFEKVNSSFFENLKTSFPDLSQTDLKVCALISLNLSMKEMAELMGISTESVKMARYRLRKKLDLVTEDNLAEFIASFKKA